MNDQLSQAYDIDNRRAGSYTVKPGQDISATDNESAKSFLKRFVEAKKDGDALNVKASRANDNLFVFGERTPFSTGNIGSFRNLFRATG